MKKLISIALIALLAGQSISPNMDACCELQKLPEFIAHFHDHQKEDGDSFFQFVYEDLMSTKGSEDGHHDDANHDDLPFHGNHQCSHAPLAFLTMQFEDGVIYSEQQPANYGYLSLVPNGFSESPFQPPKS